MVGTGLLNIVSLSSFLSTFLYILLFPWSLTMIRAFIIVITSFLILKSISGILSEGFFSVWLISTVIQVTTLIILLILSSNIFMTRASIGFSTARSAIGIFFIRVLRILIVRAIVIYSVIIPSLPWSSRPLSILYPLSDDSMWDVIFCIGL